MTYNVLGSTGLSVSAIGFGAWAIGGSLHGNSYGPTDDTVSTAAIHEALELGCTFFDTADVYGHGHSEELLGAALRSASRLNDVIIATKVGANFAGPEIYIDFSIENITKAVEGSLRRLGREYLDVCQLHNPPLETIIAGDAFIALEALRDSGKIRYFGVSIHSAAEARASLERRSSQTLQCAYNLLSLVDPRPSVAELFSVATEHGVGLIAREPLANGFLAGNHGSDRSYAKGDIRSEWPTSTRERRVRLAQSLRAFVPPEATLAQFALRFVLDEPAFATCIVGNKTPKQVRENFASIALPPLSELFRDA